MKEFDVYYRERKYGKLGEYKKLKGTVYAFDYNNALYEAREYWKGKYPIANIFVRRIK